MLLTLSPAKKLDLQSPHGLEPTTPRFREEAAHIVATVRALSVEALGRALKIKPALAEATAARFAAWGDASGRPAALTFTGETYKGLAWPRLDAAARARGQARLRLLSGLYGCLRPEDAIEAYRLDVGDRLEHQGARLTAFWRPRVTAALREAAELTDARALVNLASGEYAALVHGPDLGCPVISPRFLDARGGAYKIVSTFAKRARGAMAHWILAHDVRSPDALADFDVDGYRFDPTRSDALSPVFCRG